MHDMAETTRAAHAAGALVGLGPGALGRRGAGRPARRRRRLRRRLRLQVPERRPRRAGLRLGASAPHRAHGPRAAAPAALRLARPRGAVRVRADVPAGERHRALRLRHAVGAGDDARSNAASTSSPPPSRSAASPALRAKSIALTDLFIERVEARCAGLGLTLVTPRDAGERGSQASFAHADGYRVMQALIERGVIGDFRAGEPSAAHDGAPTGLAPTCSASASRRSTRASSTPGTRPSSCTTCWRAAPGATTRFAPRAAVT